MKPIKRILAPVDFSPGSVAAAKHAAGFAKGFDAELLLVHVAPSVQVSYPSLSAHTAAVRQQAQIDETRRAQGLLMALADSIRVNSRPETLLAEGDPAAQICSIVHSHEIDLVVMATHGLGAFRRFLLGSLTAKLLHDLEIPILTGVHLERIELFTDNYRSIGCAVGLRDEEHSAHVLRWAAELADELDANLTVFHSPHAIDFVSGAYSADEALEAKREACFRLSNLIARVGCTAKAEIVEGDPVTAITEAAASADCDALVIGRSMRQGVFGAGHADGYAILRQARCPVFSV